MICGQAMETVSPPWRWKGEACEKALGHLTGAQRLMKEPGKDRKGLPETSAMSTDEPSCNDSDVVPVSPKMAAAWCSVCLWNA